MTDSPSDRSPAESLRISPSSRANLVRYLDSPGSGSSRLPSSLRQHGSGRRPSLNFETKKPGPTRFQLPKIEPSDCGPYETIQPDEEPSPEEVDTGLLPDTPSDSSILLSDLLDHLQEEAALSSRPDFKPAFASSYSPSDYYSSADETDSSFRESSEIPGTPENLASPLDVKIPGRTLSQSYKQLVEHFPLDVNCETVTTRQNSIATESENSSVFHTDIKANPPATPSQSRRKDPTTPPTLPLSFLGPFPTPFSHRQFLVTSSPEYSSPPISSSSPRLPPSPSPLPRRRLQKKIATSTSKLRLPDIFKQRRATNKL
ncbi:uncharacterized protein N7482_004039 [Penicillium canariense]|uniref:Uncharacterized protein n=1 Tax=Penicillium canariense TaxID=189055 RepID=A0A9W9LPW2_9EURO|nr:uncharacterized protein N7482_004039 [Penicillium canariense]KAJ5168445.1 hypothetical protein N7482_004039 [Penicillium canariense]